MKNPWPSTGPELNRASAAAFPAPIRSTEPPVMPDRTPSVLDQLWRSALPCPTRQTVCRAGKMVGGHARTPAPYPHPGPTGGPVGNYGTNGAIGPWGSWK